MSLMFSSVKEFLKSVNSWWSYRKKFDTTFFDRWISEVALD